MRLQLRGRHDHHRLQGQHLPRVEVLMRGPALVSRQTTRHAVVGGSCRAGAAVREQPVLSITASNLGSAEERCGAAHGDVPAGPSAFQPWRLRGASKRLEAAAGPLGPCSRGFCAECLRQPRAGGDDADGRGAACAEGSPQGPRVGDEGGPAPDRRPAERCGYPSRAAPGPL